jgi:hypothetical protein
MLDIGSLLNAHSEHEIDMPEPTLIQGNKTLLVGPDSLQKEFLLLFLSVISLFKEFKYLVGLFI